MIEIISCVLTFIITLTVSYFGERRHFYRRIKDNTNISDFFDDYIANIMAAIIIAVVFFIITYHLSYYFVERCFLLFNP